jgi:TRAP-type C4-dicarboxylate transport system substrate-binding protein
MKRKIRWLLYHTPVELFIRTAEAFSEKITELTNGNIEIEIIPLEDYDQHVATQGEQFSPIALMQSGDIEMSQIHTSRIGTWNTPDFFALELPFLFSDHDHATRVLDGEIGMGMLGRLSQTTPMRGLAFTYSGGYRVIASDKIINNVEDLAGLKVAVFSMPILHDIVKSFGCEPMVISNRENSQEERAKRHLASLQTTLPRYQVEADAEVQKYVTNTQHSMYLTSIVISANFWDTLSIEEQAAMTEASQYSSKLERAWSIADADKIASDADEQKRLKIQNYQEFPQVEKDKMKAMSQKIYTKYTPMFSTGLVQGILDA